MNPYQRPSPRTASPASNLQTNPTRTNNQRHSSDRNSYFDTPPYSDRGVEEGDDEMVSRGDQMAETDQRQYQKINQVIQVRTASWVQGGCRANHDRTSLRNQL
jgi:autophagy-related protein 13